MPTGFLSIVLVIDSATIALLLGLWWALRKTGMLSSVPWIMASLVLGCVASTAFSPITDNYREAIDAAKISGITIGYTAIAILMMSALWKFVLVILIATNVAFLIPQGCSPGYIVSRLSRLYRCHLLFGSLLLLLSIGPTAIMWAITLGLLYAPGNFRVCSNSGNFPVMPRSA
jgi:hypothetical protein